MRASTGGNRHKAPVVVAAVLLLVASGACSDSAGALCDAMRARPDGLETVSLQGGSVLEEATWFAVLTRGVLAADPESRREIAAAVSADDEGYRRLLDAAGEIRPEVESLYRLAADADAGAAQADDPETVEAVATVSAAVGDECSG